MLILWYKRYRKWEYFDDHWSLFQLSSSSLVLKICCKNEYTTFFKFLSLSLLNDIFLGYRQIIYGSQKKDCCALKINIHPNRRCSCLILVKYIVIWVPTYMNIARCIHRSNSFPNWYMQCMILENYAACYNELSPFQANHYVSYVVVRWYTVIK